MKTSRILRHFVLILVFAVFLGFTTNPYPLPKLETEIPVVTSLWNWMQDSTVSYGLDLQGGTQLDYQIDLSDANARNADDNPDNDVDVAALLDGVRDVIERRVNSLGVSEPNIFLSSAGEEQHIVVELPGVENIDEAKDKVGKVVQLEFKTQKGDAEPSEEELAAIETQAQELYNRIAAEESLEDLEAYIEDDVVSNQLEYRKQEDAYLDELPEDFRDVIEGMEAGSFHSEVVRSKEADFIFNQGQFYQPEGFNIVRLLDKSTELRKRPVNTEAFEDVAEELGQPVSTDYVAADDIQPEALSLEIQVMDPGEITSVVEGEDGFYIAKLTDRKDANPDAEEPEIHTAHILLKTEALETPQTEKELQEIPADATEEERSALEEENAAIEEENVAIRASNADLEARNAEIEARNAEQKTKAEELLAQIKEDPTRFEDLARENSEDSSADQGGDLGYSAPSAYVEPYREAALALEKGAITDELVESQFGYHIIKLIDKKQPDEERYQFATLKVCYEGAANCDSASTMEEARTEADALLARLREESVYSFERIWLNAVPDPWESTGLDGRFFKRADVVYDQISFRPYVQVQFDDEGAQMFEDITASIVGQPLGIFVGGEFISSPTVNERISGGIAQITLGTPNVQIALQEANELAQSLNAGSIPAPLKKPNELNIGATLGQESLQKSIQAGLLGLILVAVFMVFYYRMMGILAACSLIVYGLFLGFVIQSDMSPLIAIALAFGMWIAFALNLFRSAIDGLGKAIFLVFSVVGVMFVFSVLSNPIVLTLAGVAGLILSIGMAVDANILIFERIKEEFADGKSFMAAVNDGFERAWSSILDSNVSSLITCAILFSFGTSIIKGFAINLAVGIVISMFTAITVTKTFLLLFEGRKLEKVKWLWGRKK